MRAAGGVNLPVSLCLRGSRTGAGFCAAHMFCFFRNVEQRFSGDIKRYEAVYCSKYLLSFGQTGQLVSTCSLWPGTPITALLFYQNVG